MDAETNVVAEQAPPMWQTVLRWIVLLPGAVLGCLLAGGAVMLINWLGSSRFGDDSWFTHIWGHGVKAWAQGMGLVWSGAYIAPAGEKPTAITLAGGLLFISGIAFFSTIAQRQWINTLEVVAINAGAIMAAVQIFKGGIKR